MIILLYKLEASFCRARQVPWWLHHWDLNQDGRLLMRVLHLVTKLSTLLLL
nr:hypothetical protein Iba_scaffold61514CG0010 [Ipomoea batatas]